MKAHISLFLAALLAACSPSSPPAPERNDSDAAASASADGAREPAAQDSRSGTVGPAELFGLEGSDIRDRLEGELRCGFAGEDGRMLLLAAANVDPAERGAALVRREAGVERLTATRAGGYDALVEGASFEAQGLSVTVTTGSRDPTGNETVRYRATLSVESGSGEGRDYPGLWTCGP